MANNTEQYGYIPSLPIALFGVAFFAIAILANTLQIFLGRYKHRWMYLVSVAALGEVVGWGGRAWAHFSPEDPYAFTIQICSLITAPVFLSAALYVLLSRILEKGSIHPCGLRTKAVWIFFVFCDLISLAIQVVGGIESSGSDITYDQLTIGTNTMVAGIIFQFCATTTFVLFALALPLLKPAHITSVREMIGLPTIALMVGATLAVQVRNGYRIIELRQGWKGTLMRHEIYLALLDLVPVAIATVLFCALHPANLLAMTDMVRRGSGVEDPIEMLLPHSRSLRLWAEQGRK